MALEKIQITISAATQEAESAINRMAKKAGDDIAQMAASMKSSSTAATSALETLGIRSGKVIADEARKARDAYRSMLSSGASGSDMARAEAALREHFSRLRKEMNRYKADSADGLVAPPAAVSSSSSGMAIAGHLAAVTALGIQAKEVVGAMIDAQLASSKLFASLEYSSGSAAGASAEIRYLSEVSNKLGLDFASASTAYAKFSASARSAGMSSEAVKTTFEGIAKAGTRFGLTAEEMNGALLALSQMASKGVVSMEELRGQLGERLPGAFGIAAKAMGLSQSEMIKLVESGKLMSSDFLPKFGKALNDSIAPANGLAQELNRLASSWELFKREASDSSSFGFSWLTNGLNEATAAMKSLSKETNIFSKLLLGLGGFEAGAIGAGKFNTAKVQEQKLAEFRSLGKEISELENQKYRNPMENGRLSSMNAEKERLMEEITSLAMRRGRETFSVPNLAEDFAQQKSRQKDAFDDYIKDSQSSKDKEIAAEKSRWESLTAIIGTSGKQYEEALSAHRKKLAEINKKETSAETPLQKLKFEARAADAGISPQTLKEIDALNAALKNRNIGYEEYLRLSGIAMANDPLIAKNQKAIADSIKEGDKARALVGNYKENNAQTIERIQREADLALMTDRQRIVSEALYKVEDDHRKLKDKIIAQVGNETERKMALADAEEELAAQKGKVAEVAALGYDQSSTFEYGWTKAFQRYQEEATNSAKSAESIFTSVTATMEDAIVQFSSTGKINFSSFANSVISDLIRVQAKAALSQATSAAANMFGSYFGGAGSGYGQTSGQMAIGADINSAGLGGFAKGGAFGSSGLHAFANGGTFTNGIYSEPTFFKFANGSKFGVMGEAGDEAVMPLARDSSGRLGVRAQGGAGNGGGGNVVVNVINNTDAQAKTERRSDGNGGSILDVFIDKTKDSIAADISRGSGSIPNAMQSSYNISRVAGAY